MNDSCDRCGKTEEGVGWFAEAFRRAELKNNRPDPGNLCGSCAGSFVGHRAVAEALSVETEK